MYTEFLKTEAHKTLPAVGHRRPMAIGKHYRDTIAYVAGGGIDAAREVAATMGGISKHRWSKFPERLLKECQKAHEENIKPYIIKHGKSSRGRPWHIILHLTITWEWRGKTQVPLIKHW